MTLNLPRNSTIYKIGGTNTFRRASSKFPDERGTNLQNPDKKVCGMYYAEDGYLLIQPDQGGADALVLAYLTRPGNFRDLFIHGVKPHVYVALHYFHEIWKKHKPELDINGFINAPIASLKILSGWKELDRLIKDSDNWPGKERYYFIAKQICHSSNYGARASTIQMNTLEKSEGSVALSKLEAEKYLSNYHRLFPEIQDWQRQVRDVVQRTRFLRNLFGHPREFINCKDEESLKEAYAFIPQSTVGIITSNAIISLQRYIEKEKRAWHVLNDKHDSLLVEAPEAEALECAKIARGFIEQDLESNGVKFKMKSGVAVGRNWMPYHEEKNPDGLKEL